MKNRLSLIDDFLVDGGVFLWEEWYFGRSRVGFYRIIFFSGLSYFYVSGCFFVKLFILVICGVV